MRCREKALPCPQLEQSAVANLAQKVVVLHFLSLYSSFLVYAN